MKENTVKAWAICYGEKDEILTRCDRGEYHIYYDRTIAEKKIKQWGCMKIRKVTININNGGD